MRAFDWPKFSEEADGEQITPAGKEGKKSTIISILQNIQRTFFQEIRDVRLELVPHADLTFIGKKGLLLRVIHQRVEEGVLGNAVGREV